MTLKRANEIVQIAMINLMKGYQVDLNGKKLLKAIEVVSKHKETK